MFQKPLAMMAFAIGISLSIFTQTAASAAPLKKVRIVVGTASLNIGYPWLNLPLALGYWKDEGYDVELVPLAPPAQAITLLVAKQADLAMVNSTALVQARVINKEPVEVAMLNGIIDWRVGVSADSPIKSLKDLKGKTIGAFGIASGGVALLKAALADNGLDPEKDVTIVSVGGGAPAALALQSGNVQALIFWASAMAAFENAGLKLRYMTGNGWRQLPDYTLAVMKQTADSDPKMVEAIVRGAAKATVFALANPECVRKIQWKNWPSTKPTGSSDDAALRRWDLNSLNTQLSTLQDSFVLNGGKYYGNFDPATYDRLQAFMLRTKQINTTVPAVQYETGIANLYQQANNFDAAAVRKAARECSAG